MNERDDDSISALAFVAGIGAWLTTCFCTGFLGVAGVASLGEPYTLFVAVLFGFAAIAMAHPRYASHQESPFFAQLILSFAFTSPVLAAVAVMSMEKPAIFGVMSFFCSLLYLLIERPVVRFGMAAIWVATICALLYKHGAVTAVLFVVLLALPAVLYAGKRWISTSIRDGLAPLSYACVVAALALCIEPVSAELWEHFEVSAKIATAIIAAACAGVAFLEAPAQQRRLVAVAAAIGALGLVSTAGILAALLITALGTWRDDFTATALGTAALCAHLISYYYFLDVTLLAKSGILVASGAILLALRAVAFPKEAADA